MHRMVVGAIVAWTSACVFADVSIDVTRVGQNWPWNRDVLVTFSVSGAERPVDIDVSLSSNGKTVAVPAGAISGDAVSLTNGSYTLRMDPTKTDFAGERLLSDAKVVLKAVDERLYMVVDLSTGEVGFRNAVDGAGSQWADAYKTDKLVLKRVKATTFKMGNTKQRSSYGHEYPQHDVTLTRDYYLGVYELTIAQYRKMGGAWPIKAGSDQYFTADEPARPVHCLRWYTLRGLDGQVSEIPPETSLLGKLGTKTGGAYVFDYPTEAQWENACQAGHVGERYDGNDGDFSDAEWSANMDSGNVLNAIARNTNNVGSVALDVPADNGGLARVGSYAPNAWGFYDMLGNVYEWTRDGYAAVHGDLPQLDPGLLPTASGSAYYAVLKGGSYLCGLRDCRALKRVSSQTGFSPTEYGVRLCATVR